MQKKILLTGGTGYIGSHCAVDMIQAGFDVVIFDNLSNSSDSALDGIEKITGVCPDFVQGDIRNIQDLDAVFSQYSFSSVIHFAGLKAVGESCEKPLDYYQNNVIGTLNLLEVMQQYTVKTIVFSSSACVYDMASAYEFVETDRLGPSNPYGGTKYVIEQLLKDATERSDLRSVSLRYFNPIGAHESGIIGEEPQGIPNNLLPFVLDVASGKREKVTVYGDDYDTPDGTGIRDYLHVMDLVEAHRDALQYIDKQSDGHYEVFNLGTGTGTSVREIIAFVREASGHDVPEVVGSRRPGDVAKYWSDPSKAHRVLNWKSKRTVQQAVEDAWRFIAKGDND